MFPARDLPAIVNDNNTPSIEPAESTEPAEPTEPAESTKPTEPAQFNNTKKTNQKHAVSMTISHQECSTLLCIALILFIIIIAIFVGLLSVFIPTPNDDSPIVPAKEIVALTSILPITQNSSYVLSLNNNSLMADNYFDSAQRNILKTCLQTRLNSGNGTQFMAILSIDSARAQYSGTNNSQLKQWSRRKRRRVRRQTPLLADQVEFTISVQCTPLIWKIDCLQLIRLELDNRESLKCTLTDEIRTTLSSSSSTTTTIKSIIVASTQHWRQVGSLFLGFGLTSLVGLERQLRGKSAGLRTHSIVGTTSALILLISKYGFSDVVGDGYAILDPSRIAAQIISGISFLGAGLIITRHRAIRGLTTAASVWSAAAIGMAAGSGLWVVSLVVTGLHFIIVLGFLPLEKRLPVFDKKSPFFRKADDDEEVDEDTQSV